MPPKRSKPSRRDNDNIRPNNQNAIDAVEFQNTFLFLFGVYAFAAVLSRNAAPTRAPGIVINGGRNVSAYRARGGSGSNRFDRTGGAAPSARALRPAPAPAATAAAPPQTPPRGGRYSPNPALDSTPPNYDTAHNYSPITHFASTPPNPAPAPIPPNYDAAHHYSPITHFASTPPNPAPAPIPPNYDAAHHYSPSPAPAPTPPNRDAAHHYRQRNDPNEIMHEYGGYSRATLEYVETVRRRRGSELGGDTLMGNVIAALHGIPHGSQIHNRAFVEVGEGEEEEGRNVAARIAARGQRQGAAGAVRENWFLVDEPGRYPSHLDRMGPQFAPFRQDREPEPPRLAQPRPQGGGGIMNVVVVNADGAPDPDFGGYGGANIGAQVVVPAAEASSSAEPPHYVYEDWDSDGGWSRERTPIDTKLDEVINISDDASDGGGNGGNDDNNAQGQGQDVRGRKVSPLRSTKRGRGSSGSPSSRANKRSRRTSPRASAAPAAPAAPTAPSGFPTPPDSQALAHRLPANAVTAVAPQAHTHARPRRLLNYVPEHVGAVRDPCNLLCGRVRDFDTLTPQEKTDLALDHCAGTHARFVAVTHIAYERGLSRDAAHRFTLHVAAYRNGGAEQGACALAYFKCHPLHMAGSARMAHGIKTSQLPRAPEPNYTAAELAKCSRTTRALRALIRGRSAAGYAGSEYSRAQTVLRYQATNYTCVDRWQVELWDGTAAGPTIFALRSAYKAATGGDCLLTARLGYEGRAIAQCAMSALEDRQGARGGLVEEEVEEVEGVDRGWAESPVGCGGVMSVGRDL